MKKLIICLLVIAQCQVLSAQQNVGIGTSSPSASAQLEVASTTKGLLIPRMTGAQRTAIAAPVAGLLVYQTNTEPFPPSAVGFYLYDAGAWKRIARADEITSGTSSWTVSGSNQFSNVSGNVGIGVSPNASAKLDISSTTGGLLIPRMTIGQRISIANPARGLITYDTDLDEFWYYDGTGWEKILNSNYDYWIKPSNHHWVYNTGDSIAIGINSPTQRLDVNGNIRSRDNLIVDENISAIGNVQGGAVTSLGNVLALGNGTFNGNLTSNTNLSVAGTSLLTGNVTGNSNLSVAGTSLFSGNVTANSDIIINNSTAILQLKNGGVSKGFVQLSGDDLRVGTNSSNATGRFVVRTGTGGGEHFFVDQAGYIGIGVSANSAEAKVHVGSGVGVSLTQNGYLMLGNSAGTNMVFDNNEIQARTSGAAASMILQRSGGSVRIGATSVPSGYKFGVDGKIICEELKVKLVSSGWPDYVFEDNYDLPSLKDVEQFIQQNKHLPNIPSATEIEKNGIEVGDMQKRMMEKIEQLTLYVIELQKQVDQFKKTSK